jgi:hypothetical protein
VSEETRRAGDAIAASAGELARLWRATQAQSGSGFSPGLLDGLVDELFVRVGEALAEDRDPALVWPSLGGLVRLDAHDRNRSLAELDAEWDAAEGVLAGAREALGASQAVTDWLGRALAAARAGARALAAAGDRGPFVVVWWLSSPGAVTRRPRGGGRT